MSAKLTDVAGYLMHAEIEKLSSPVLKQHEPIMNQNKHENWKYMPLLLFQFVLVGLYFAFVKYEGETGHDLRGFEGTHLMIFIGFGFLMTFLKKYAYSALGFNWFLAALVVQWALLCQSFYEMKDNTIYINKKSILEADVMSATVLITFGAVLGLASGLQLLFISIIEVAIGCFNLYLVGHIFKAADVGGSIAIHAFGAYFGLGVSWAIRPRKKTEQTPSETPANELNGPTYVSDVTAMIGSIFLWIYWPSFNSALCTSNSSYQRAVVNTYLSLASAAVTTFVMSALVSHNRDGKLDMVHVQNSTLAGGVAIGSVCNMFVQPGGAIAIGIGAGILSVLGYRYLSPFLVKIGIPDTCGVNNLHGMPGVYSGILSVIFAYLATVEVYGIDLLFVFEAMATDNSTGRTAPVQAVNQLYALLATLAISLVGGAITGFLAKLPVLEPLKEKDHYNDEPNFELP